MTNYFIFNGESSLDYGIKVPELPVRTRAPRRTVKTVVPGRSGTYTYNEKNGDEDVYEAYPSSWEIVIKDERDINRALEWLSGSGEIIFSDELDRAYKVDFYEQISLSRIFKKWRRGPISCEFQPFKYDRFPTEIKILGEGTVTDRFRVETQRKIPLFLKVHLSSVGAQTTVTLNGNLLTVAAPGIQAVQTQHPWLILDCERQEIMFENGRDAGLATSGTFPLKLINGYNEISVSNTVATRIIYRGIYL